MPPETQATDLTSIAVSLGRVEATMTAGFSSVNERIDKLSTTAEATTSTLQRHEVDIQLLKSKDRPRAPWYSVVGAIVGIVGGLGSIVAIFITLTQISAALAK